MKLYNKNRVPVELYNAAGAAIIIPPRTTVTVDASFAQNLPKGVIIKKQENNDYDIQIITWCLYF